MLYLFLMNHSDPLNKYKPRKSWQKVVCLFTQWIVLLHVCVGGFSTKGEAAVVGSQQLFHCAVFLLFLRQLYSGYARCTQMLFARLNDFTVCFFISNLNRNAFLRIFFLSKLYTFVTILRLGIFDFLNTKKLSKCGFCSINSHFHFVTRVNEILIFSLL